MPTRAVLMALAGGACLTGVAVVAADTKRAEPPYPAVAPVPAAGPASSVTEPYSKTAFPERTEDGLVLLGVGLRSKYSLFSVYAYAIYGRPGDLSMLRTLPDDQFFTQVMTIESPKRIDLVFLRDITGADMKEAFATSLGQRTKDAEALKSFAAQFDNIQLKHNAKLSFYVTYSGGNGHVTTSLDNRTLGTVSSSSLTMALLDVYLGAHPISNDIKPSIVSRRKLLY